MITYTLRWLPHATISYRRILDYLRREWNQKVLNNFIDITDKNLLLLSQGKIRGTESDKNLGVHRILITKHSYLIYRLRPRKKEIELLVFWDTRQNPTKLNF